MAQAPEAVRTIVEEVFQDIPYQPLSGDDEKVGSLLAQHDGVQIGIRLAHGYDFDNFEQLGMFGIKMNHIDGQGVYDQESCILAVGDPAEATSCIRVVLSSLFMAGVGRFRGMGGEKLSSEFLRMAEIIKVQTR